jgi:hypothetical protein
VTISQEKERIEVEADNSSTSSAEANKGGPIPMNILYYLNF